MICSPVNIRWKILSRGISTWLEDDTWEVRKSWSRRRRGRDRGVAVRSRSPTQVTFGKRLWHYGLHLCFSLPSWRYTRKCFLRARLCVSDEYVWGVLHRDVGVWFSWWGAHATFDTSTAVAGAAQSSLHSSRTLRAQARASQGRLPLPWHCPGWALGMLRAQWWMNKLMRSDMLYTHCLHFSLNFS